MCLLYNIESEAKSIDKFIKKKGNIISAIYQMTADNIVRFLFPVAWRDAANLLEYLTEIIDIGKTAQFGDLRD